MSQQAVRAVIETLLWDWIDDNDLTIVGENQKFTIPTTTYARFRLLPAQTQSEDLAGAHRAWIGVAQIDIAIPIGGGPQESEGYLKSLDALYPCSALLPGPVLPVAILTPVSAGPGANDGAHWVVPMSFQYRADFVST